MKWEENVLGEFPGKLEMENGYDQNLAYIHACMKFPKNKQKTFHLKIIYLQ